MNVLFYLKELKLKIIISNFIDDVILMDTN